MIRNGISKASSFDARSSSLASPQFQFDVLPVMRANQYVQLWQSKAFGVDTTWPKVNKVRFVIKESQMALLHKGLKNRATLIELKFK